MVYIDPMMQTNKKKQRYTLVPRCRTLVKTPYNNTWNQCGVIVSMAKT